MDHVFSILPKVLRQRGLEGHAAAAHALVLARRWITEELPSLAVSLKPRNVDGTHLVLEATDATALKKASGKTDDLLRFLMPHSLPIDAVQIVLKANSSL